MRIGVIAFLGVISLASGLFAETGGTGTMKLDGQAVKLIDAFAYSGELIEYDEDGNRKDHYDIVLTAEKIDRGSIGASEPVSDFNLWLYTEEPATLTIRLGPELQSGFMTASRKGEFHSNAMRCYCDGAVSEVKLENGRMRGRVHTPKGLKSQHEGAEDPSVGRTLEFDIEIDIPLVRIVP